MWVVYEVCLFIALLLYLPRALVRRRLPHRGWMMRLGRYPRPVLSRLHGAGKTLWIHAVSVGEVLAVQPLLAELMTHSPHPRVVLSTVTPTGFGVASRLLGRRGVVIYAPLDFRVFVRQALRDIQPHLLLLVESEFWPTLIRLTHQQGVPIVIVNGRISARAHRRYLWVTPWLKGVLERVSLFLMQADVDAERVIAIGAPRDRVRVLGNLKWDASLSSRPQQAQCDALARRLGLGQDQALLVAGSTHRGEEQRVLQAVKFLRARKVPVRLMIAPRHLERLGEIEELIRRAGFVGKRLSALTASSDSWEVLLVDSLGQLPLYYGLATVVFVGGSLVPHGGQNPLEAASLGKPVVVGPSMDNFAEITQQLLDNQALVQLRGAFELSSVLQELLTDHGKALAIGRRAQDLVESLSGTGHRTLEALGPFLTSAASRT
jgi:3-deoxy-D-manno-octulosonic-acid transferase